MTLFWIVEFLSNYLYLIKNFFKYQYFVVYFELLDEQVFVFCNKVLYLWPSLIVDENIFNRLSSHN